jgi:hypothetical protein
MTLCIISTGEIISIMHKSQSGAIGLVLLSLYLNPDKYVVFNHKEVAITILYMKYSKAETMWDDNLTFSNLGLKAHFRILYCV